MRQPGIEPGPLAWKASILTTRLLALICIIRPLNEMNHLGRLSGEGESNARPIDLQSIALPTELSPVYTIR